MSSYTTVVRTLIEQAIASRHRRLLVISGDVDWCHERAREVVADPALSRVVWISNLKDASLEVLSSDKVKSLLGQERDAVVFDAHAGLDPDALGAVSGIIPGGGLLLLLCPPLSQWPRLTDPAAERIAIWPYEARQISGRFIQRLVKYLQRDALVTHIEQDRQVSIATVLPSHTVPEIRPQETFASPCQQDAVEAIHHVLHGHRHRPLVLLSDRGRGKSSALGIAAAQLMLEATSPLRIVVTAPRPDAVKTLFERAQHQLPQAIHRAGYLEYMNSTLEFIAPDVLCLTELDADLLLVDEAAAIPTGLLQQLLARYSRLVFATTVHGYEGTGRGFTVRFRQVLDRQTPGWRELRLTTPMRWSDHDPLEQWTFRALLLDAEVADDNTVIELDLDDVQFEHIDRDVLVQDEQTLSQIFGLLVVAHYRTTPNDLRNLLDGPGLSVYVARLGNNIVATALVSSEGGFDAELADAIYAGQRRPRGHLLAQSLLAHIGLRQSANLRCERIMRIAVHPAIQRRGIGRRLLEYIKQTVQQAGADVLGASFGATADLLRFWMQSELIPVRVGFHRDHASGEYSVMVLTPLTPDGSEVYSLARHRFMRDLSHWLADPLRNLDSRLVEQLLIADDLDVSGINDGLSLLDISTLHVFAEGLRSYEDSLGAIWRLCISGLEIADLSLPENVKQLLIHKVLQRQSWGEVAEQCGLSGRAEVVAGLREAVGLLLKSVANEVASGE